MRTMKLGMRVWCSASSLLSLRPLERYRPRASVSDGPPGIRCVRGTTALNKVRHAAGQYDGKRGQVENVGVVSHVAPPFGGRSCPTRKGTLRLC